MKMLLAIIAVLALTLNTFADPIKKEKIDNDKLCTECFEAFWKVIKDGTVEDITNLMDTPFRDEDGKILDTLDKFKKELSNRPQELNSLTVTIIDIVELKKVNDYLKKKEFPELSEEDLKLYEDVIGKEGRVVFIEASVNGRKESNGRTLAHMLFKIKGDKAKVVGIGGN